MIGIYAIKCIITKKVYIGSSVNINSRLINHEIALRKNRHSNSYLQNAWNKYGKEWFKFSIILECDRKDLLHYENFYISKNDSLNSQKGYNLVIAERKDDLYCNKEYLNKLSNAKKGKIPSNFKLCKLKLQRPILEFENGIFITEYSSCKEAGRILNINYKRINNVLRGVVKQVKKYPNKTWIYKDNKPVRKIKKTSSPWNKGCHKKVIQYDYNKNIINIFNSLEEAAKKLKISKNTISNNCNKHTKRCIVLKCVFKYEN